MFGYVYCHGFVLVVAVAVPVLVVVIALGSVLLVLLVLLSILLTLLTLLILLILLSFSSLLLVVSIDDANAGPQACNLWTVWAGAVGWKFTWG